MVSIKTAKTLDTLAIVHKVAGIAFSKKAEEVVLLDLKELSTLTDYYFICTCQNEPQMRALKNAVVRALSKDGVKALRAEYMPGVRWAIIDYGEIIIHIFEKAARGYYSLERLWGDAKTIQFKPEDFVQDAIEPDDENEDDDI